MKPWLAGLVLALAACSQPAGTPVANATASPGLSCRLPIYRYANGGGIEDSFITFPGGSVVVDPAGHNGMYFDKAFSRWVPVSRQAVSPDGAHYATVEMSSEQDVFFIHIVDVATGQVRSIRETAAATGFGAQPIVFDYAAEGIYFVQAFEHVWPGVWLFDPVSGSMRKVAEVETPEIIGGGGALWFGQVNLADPSPLISGSSAGVFPDEVGRFDLKAGSSARWLYRPGAGLVVVGLDASGRPLVRALKAVAHPVAKGDPIDSSATELLIALDDHTQKSIYTGQLVNVLTSPIADAHGVWFGSDRGIYLYSDARGLQKVSDHPGIPANGCF